MKLGAQLYSLRKQLASPEMIEEGFKKVHDIGYECIQVSGLGKFDPVQVKNAADKNQLPITITHSDYNRIVNDTEALIRDHKIMNCPVIGLGSLPKEFRPGETRPISEFFEELKKPVQMIREAGLAFAYHNHDFEFKITMENGQNFYDYVIDNEPDWQMIVDVYWLTFANQDPIAYIKKLGGKRIPNIHFKDLGKDEKRSICACGDGTIDFVAIEKVCREVGVKNVLVEQDNATDFENPFGEMEKSFKHLRPIVH